MLRTKVRTKAFTLVEVLIVIAIVAILVGVLWIVMAPKAKESSRASAISMGLKQASDGLAIYRADNNDSFPGNWQEFGFGKPNRADYIAQGAIPTISAPPEYPEAWRTENGRGQTKLTYLYNRGVQKIVASFTPVYPFDESKYPVFAANFFMRISAEHGRPWVFAPPKMRTFSGPGKEYQRLGGYADGHVKWGPDPDVWEKEYDYRMNFGDQ